MRTPPAGAMEIIGVTGKLQNQDGLVHLLVDRLWAPNLEQAPAHAPGRDFH